MTRLVWRLAALAVVILAPGWSKAGAILTISDLNEAAPTVTSSGFTTSTTITTFDPGTGAETAGFTGTFPTTSPVGFAGSGTVGMGEAGGGLSDFFTATWSVASGPTGNVATIIANFFSDPLTNPTALVSIVEDGTVQDVTGSFLNNIGGPISLPQGIQINLQSDAAAPEPTSLAVFGMVMAGAAGYYGWRRRRQAVAG
jgi:hypothetical protein